MKRKYIYLAVTADEYEFPIELAETAEEMAKKFGIKKGSVLSEISRNRSGTNWGYKFVRVKNASSENGTC